MKRLVYILILTLSIASLTPILSYADDDVIQIYVSRDASEYGTGSIERPYKTIEDAQSAVRASKYRGKKTIEVIIRGGLYEVSRAIEFNGTDSGSDEHNVIYKAYEGEEVIFSGAKTITPDMLSYELPRDVKSRLRPEAADKIAMVDLKKLGVEKLDKEQQDFINKNLATGDYNLYGSNKMLTRSRYPNSGYMSSGKVLVNGSGGALPVFQYTDDRLESWKHPENIWIWGKFRYSYSPDKNCLAAIDPETKTFTCAKQTPYGSGSYLPYNGDSEMYFYNVLEETDMPGEYYIDRGAKVLYLYPVQNDTEDKNYYFSYIDDNIFKLEKASNIELCGITVQGSRKPGISVKDGENITVNKCLVRYVSNTGVMVSGGTGHTVKNCDIHDVSYEGVCMEMGSIDYLMDGNGIVTNNHIYRFGTADVNYTGAVEFYGKGITVSHNLMHDSYSMAMTFIGIDCLIEYNEIYDVATEADDSAAIYDWARMYSRNVVFRYNMIYNHQKRKQISHTGTFAMYWDGTGAGKEVYGNIFYNMNRGVFINCGGFHNIENNIFVDVDNPIRTGPNTNIGLAYGLWYEVTNNNPYRFTKGVWKQEYPIIAADFYGSDETRSNFQQYREDYIGDNIVYNCGDSIKDSTTYKDNKNYFRPDIELDEDIFEDIDNLNFKIKEGMCPENFDDIIDVDKIGLLDYDV